MAKIILAKTAGFCWGVKRAIDMTLETARLKKGSIFTFGPLIHNPQLIDLLKNKNIHIANTLDEVQSNDVVIRTHGITPQKRAEIKGSGLSVTDATCPLVARVQGIIKKHSNKGYTIIIVGDDGHAEIIGLKGYAKTACHVIADETAVAALPEHDKVFVCAQTTCDRKKYAAAIEALKKRYSNIEVGDTICAATYERQDEMYELVPDTDLMVVVGGKNSANTTRLASIAKEQGVRTMHIETDDEISADDLKNAEVITVTAGASTPKWMIERVMQKLNRLANPPSGLLDKMAELMRFIVKSNIYLALGGASLAYGNLLVTGIPPRLPLLAIPFFAILSTYLLHQLLNASDLMVSNRSRYEYHDRYRVTFLSIGIGALILGFTFSILEGWLPALLFSSLVALGTLYGTNIAASGISFFGRLKKIPASRGILSSTGWAIVTLIIPLLSSTNQPNFIYPLAFTLSIAYARSVLYELRDISDDQVAGIEIMPHLLGIDRTKTVVAVIMLLCTIILTYGYINGMITSGYYGMVAAIAYLLWFASVVTRFKWHSSLRFELFLDAQYFLYTAALLLTTR